MSERKRIFLLIAIMVTSCVVVTGATIAILYKTAIKEGRAQLMETAQSQARLIEAVARFDAIYSKSYPGGSRPATLSQVIDAHDHYTGFGKTGEFTLSKKEENNIVFLLSHRHYDLDKPKPVPFESELAEPMRRALLGQSGTVVGLDYRGEMVLAAYEPVSELNWGIVAKIDMSEVRTPFVKAGLVGTFFTALVVLIGTSFFIRITNPMIRQLENRTLKLEKMNDEMKIEINERKKAQEALQQIEWLLTKSLESEPVQNEDYIQPYGNLSELNNERKILESVGEIVLSDIVADFLYLLDTSAAVYEKNGDYALGLFASNWCKFLDQTSRNLCDTNDNREALKSGKWLCHESCWEEASKISIETGKTIDVECCGGIWLYAVPIFAGESIIGSINMGYGDPPRDSQKLKEISEKFALDVEELTERAELYQSRPHFIIDYAKKRLNASARLIGEIVERKRVEKELRKARNELEQQVEKRTAELVKTNEQLEKEIEERKRADKAVRESEERYALAIAGSTDGIWDWDITLDTVFYSDRFREILGYSPEEFPGEVDTFRTLLHPEDADVTWSAVERHLQKGVPYNVECRLQTKPGEFRWFLARGQAIWDSKGNATRMSGSLQDITERVEAVQNLRDALSEIRKLKENLEAERAYLQEEIKLEHNFENIIGQSNDLNYVLYKVEQIATTDTPVLVLGETGAGKELVARAIHGSSPRKDKPLLKVNCATLPLNLIESELFGHERGAFTGAYARQFGRFEVANGATIFLDEIGELPLELQPKLLRVIQDGEFERLGSSKTVKVDVRIIAVTNRNLEEEVRNGRFREDLWYRLNIFPITVPPLRERMEDLPLLVEFFVDKISRRLGKSIKNIPTNVMNTLQNYHWPGNIRELENVIERAVINSSGPKLRLMDELKKQHKELTTTQKTLKEVEHDYIVQVLEQANWKISGKNGASEILGLDRSTLRARMRKLGIGRP
jgi:chemotaxis protein methyltransferase CheR